VPPLLGCKRTDPEWVRPRAGGVYRSHGVPIRPIVSGSRAGGLWHRSNMAASLTRDGITADPEGSLERKTCTKSPMLVRLIARFDSVHKIQSFHGRMRNDAASPIQQTRLATIRLRR